MSGVLRVSESVTPGHVDRCADAIAERLVEESITRFGGARCGIEVALNATEVVLQGYVLTLPPMDDTIFSRGYDIIDFDSNADLTRVVIETLVDCGYVGVHEHAVSVRSQLLVDEIEDDEQTNSALSDDQVIVVGYATPFDVHGNLPIEAFAARAAQRAAFECALANSETLGPDGKVLLGVREHGDGAAVVEFVNLSIQHREGVDYGELYQLLGEPVLGALRGVEGLDVPDDLWAREFVINGRGQFTEGGVRGDTGLSGKKLVADLYGPRVPIGGGAISGKDQFKADRIGTFLARSIAVKLASISGSSATVTLAWFPGEAEPRGVQAELSDGRVLDRNEIAALVSIGNLSIASAVDDLFYVRPPWTYLERQGYVGIDQRWDRA